MLDPEQSPRHDQRVLFGPFDVDFHCGELRKHGRRIRIQQQPLRILRLLLERPGELVTREELRERLWPNGFHLDFEHGLNRSINKLRRALSDTADHARYVETLPGRGYRFIGATSPDHKDANVDEPAFAIRHDFRGALPLDSPFYMDREIDHLVSSALERQESIVLLKGARQTGKSSLLSRVLDKARREKNKRVAITDLEKLNSTQMETVNSTLMALATNLCEQLSLDIEIGDQWSERRGASMNFDRFVKKTLLAQETPLVWAIDEADRLFSHNFANEIFALFRSWHNERALDRESAIRHLTLIIAYATEAHLFISDLSQSPFNVGLRFTLEDFNFEEVGTLNGRYARIADAESLEGIFDWMAGHPYLTQTVLDELSISRRPFADLADGFLKDDSRFSGHLRRLKGALCRNDELRRNVVAVLCGNGPISSDAFYRLRSAGLLVGTNDVPRLRCRLYREFFRREFQNGQDDNSAKLPD